MNETRLIVIALLAAGAGAWTAVAQAEPRPLAAVRAEAAAAGDSAAFDGVVEAVRQTVVAAQVAGAIVRLDVVAGQRVQAGQVLMRIDARSADQAVAASDAQVRAARAQLDVAAKDYERQKLLQQQNFISRAALDRAESQFKATEAEVAAQLAQAGAARTQTGFHTVRAPYAGVVSEVPVALGDMAMPGRPLLTLYDPAVLRITASVPQSAVAALPAQALPAAEVPGVAAAQRRPAVQKMQLLPTVDAATHTMQIRLELAPRIDGLAPGMFARVWLPQAATRPRISVPAAAIVRRAEMTGLYVLGADGRPQLRQVRLGRSAADRVEVLAGVADGEQVALDPAAAARIR